MREQTVFVQYVRRVRRVLVEAQQRDIAHELRDEDLTPTERAAVGRWIRSAEGQFFMRMWVPSMLLAGMDPWQLMRKARGGDLKAMGTLLVLDKSAVHDPKVAARFQSAATGNRVLFRRLAHALASYPPKMGKPAVKRKLAALASRMFQPLGGIHAPELRELFDAVEHVRSGGTHLRDTDLPAGDWALTKALQRGREHWTLLDGLDKTKS